jgi:hypothetical protein
VAHNPSVRRGRAGVGVEQFEFRGQTLTLTLPGLPGEGIRGNLFESLFEFFLLQHHHPAVHPIMKLSAKFFADDVPFPCTCRNEMDFSAQARHRIQLYAKVGKKEIMNDILARQFNLDCAIDWNMQWPARKFRPVVIGASQVGEIFS